jgi:hypothetical protein
VVARLRWVRIVGAVAGVELVLLFVQYALGLWTNLYGPDTFNTNTSLASLDWHFIVGDLLFLVGIVIVILAALARAVRLIVPAVVLVIAVYAAGAFGMAFVNSTPNNPIYSFGMGIMFLVALFSDLAIMGQAWRRSLWQAAMAPMAPSPTVPAP